MSTLTRLPLCRSGLPAVSYPWDGKLHLNITNRCTLRCRFCPRSAKQWMRFGHNLALRREPDVGDIMEAAGDPRAYDEVVFSGLGEPSLRLYHALEAGRQLRRRGGRVRMVTNGLANLVYRRDVTPDLEGNIDALSVSFIAQNEATYNRHCCPRGRGSYDAMMDFVERARDFVPEVEITAIELPGVDLDACGRIAADLGVGFRARRYGEIE